MGSWPVIRAKRRSGVYLTVRPILCSSDLDYYQNLPGGTPKDKVFSIVMGVTAVAILCRCQRIAVQVGLPLFLLCGAPAITAEARDSQDRTADCGPWAFAEEGPSPGHAIEAAAFLPCGDDYAIILQCRVSNFIANFRYYPTVEDGNGYELFRFTMNEQDIDFWLRIEGLDGAWAGYREFAHPLFEAMQGDGVLVVLNLNSGQSEVLPMDNAGPSIEALLDFC